MCPGEESVAGYVAGRLPRDERDAFESHLDTCTACQELVAALAKLQPPRSVAASATTLADAGVADDPTDIRGGQLGRYVLLSRLGAGGMGVVYAAYDPELDRRIALKVLRRVREGSHLRDEARAIARLAHPNVVAVHDVGEVDGEVFIAMEHVEGVTVRDWLATPRAPRAILDVFVQAGRGLAAAHAVGLVHRDVKPGNIILGPDGRARVVDFGLARGEADAAGFAGTPAYMAPEQERGERVDARADQYAFCVALWEALAGAHRDERTAIPGVPDRVVRALTRGLSAHPDDRFPSIDALLAEITPRSHVRRWVIATFAAAGALIASLTLFALHASPPPAPSCATAAAALRAVWNEPRKAAIRSAFAATHVPYAASAATTALDRLDDWAARWQRGAEASCRATVIDRVQPAALHALRRGCLDELLERLRAVTEVAASADPAVVATATTLASSLPAPERCDDVTALSALPPLPPAERDRAEIAALRVTIASDLAAITAGRANQLDVTDLQRRAAALGYLPLRARTEFVVARLESARSHYDQAIAALHRAVQAALASRDVEQLAEAWIELAQTLGDDPRTVDEAQVFDGYAAALIPQLPDHEPLALQLELARCNANTGALDAKTLAGHCQAAIDRAEHATPPRATIANAARIRLGNFQRMLGNTDQALATLKAAVAEAIRVQGAQHPDTAIAHYALGIALLTLERFDEGIAELRIALDIRRAAYPGNSVQVAESLQGLGDALASAGNDADAVDLLGQAIAMLEAVHQGDSAEAMASHALLAMSLEALHRGDEAITHYLRSTDIADHALQHREAVAAMNLQRAADLELRRGHRAAAIADLQRAVALLERGKADPAKIAAVQKQLAELPSTRRDRRSSSRQRSPSRARPARDPRW